MLRLLSLPREARAKSITLPISNPFPSPIENGALPLRKGVLLSPKAGSDPSPPLGRVADQLCRSCSQECDLQLTMETDLLSG